MEISVNNSSSVQSNSQKTTQSQNEKTQGSSFSTALEKAQEESSKKTVVADTQVTTKSLVEDIISVLRTGFTVEELKAIEKLLQAIREKIEEEKKTRNVSQGEIEAMFKEVERMILELKKSRKGIAVVEAKDDTSIKTEKIEDSVLAQFEARLKEIQTVFEEMLNGTQKKKSQTQSYEELKLIQELK